MQKLGLINFYINSNSAFLTEIRATQKKLIFYLLENFLFIKLS